MSRQKETKLWVDPFTFSPGLATRNDFEFRLHAQN